MLAAAAASTVYNRFGTRLSSTNSANLGVAPFTLWVIDNGNIGIVDATNRYVWQTNTAQP